VSQDFVKTILGIKGGSGNQITAYLKKIGFATADGTPTDLYKKFRNSVTEGWAATQALKTGYAPLYVRNEYMHKLSDEDLKGLVVEETGAGQDSNIVPLIVACIKQLKKFANRTRHPSENDMRSPLQRRSLPALLLYRTAKAYPVRNGSALIWGTLSTSTFPPHRIPRCPMQFFVH
jgi:hypothetical protein